MRYFRIFIESVGGRWFLVPSAVTGIVALVTVLKGLGMFWIPDLSYWELALFAVLPVAVWSIIGLMAKVVKLEDTEAKRRHAQPRLYFGNPIVQKIQLYETRIIATNIGTKAHRVPTYQVNVASVPLHNKPIMKSDVSKLQGAHITLEFHNKDTEQLSKVLQFGRWADNIQLGQHDSPSSVDPLRYRDIEPNDGANLVDIALKYDADENCCTFNSESWLEPNLKNPKWVLNGTKFNVKVIIKSSNHDDYEEWFEIQNLGKGNSLRIVRRVQQ